MDTIERAEEKGKEVRRESAGPWLFGSSSPKTQIEEWKSGNSDAQKEMVNVNGDVEITKPVLTAPFRLEGEADGQDYRPPNLLQRVLSLLKNVRPGTDLFHFQLPPVFNIPKSMLQCYGETIYCTSKDLLSECANGETSLDRLISVVAWNLSTLRPIMFGASPYNPILGETHHVSRGTLNVLLEQVSHHPPVSALHATDEKEGIEILWCHHLVPKFNGTSVETVGQGERQLKLLKKGESYFIGHPNLVIRFLPVPGVYWSGNMRIHCPETGLEAQLIFGPHSFLGLKANHKSVKGKILVSSSMKTMYEINGNWDRAVTAKEVTKGNLTVIYEAHEVLSGLQTPILQDPKGMKPTESAIVWAEVSQSILSKCWDKAREAKTTIEEKERKLVKDRKAKGETWVPNHFTVSHSKESGWHCSPNQECVPPAPIVVPLP
ncbi:hypothetical protein U1Q18_026626 [Sarracenia purpurea var. burkii]